jgi:hypothetical protein
MAGFRIEGNTSDNVAEVDTNNRMLVNLPTTITEAGFVLAASTVDAGTITGTLLARFPMVNRDLRESSGLDTGIFDYIFSAAAQDTGVWHYVATTAMSASQTGGFLLLNANSTATAAASATMNTWRTFGWETRGGLRVQVVGMITATILANQIVELGLYVPTAATAPADGVYFRITSAGIIGVVNYNGTETPSGIIISPPAIGTAYVFDIIVSISGVEFWINGILGVTIQIPPGDGQAYLNMSLPLTLTQRNSGTVVGAQMQFKVSSCHVTFLDMFIGMPLAHQATAQGLMCQQGTSGGTMGSTELFTNNLASGAGAVMTNTTQALGAGLGGQFSTQPTLAVGTDGIICGYLVPAGTVTAKGRILMITGVKVHGAVSTTAITGGPILYAYSLAYGTTAITLVTAESGSFVSGTAKASRRVALGFETFAATAAVGTLGSTGGCYMAFNSPIAVNPGEYVQVCAKNLGVVSSAGVITFLVSFDGYWL